MVAIIDISGNIISFLTYCIFPLGTTYLIIERLVYIHKTARFFSLTKKFKLSLSLLTLTDLKYLTLVQFFFLITYKLNSNILITNKNNFLIFISIFTLLFFIFFMLKFNENNLKTTEISSYTTLVFIISLVGILGFLIIEDILSFIFSLEFLSLTYYFFFLTKLNKNYISLLKYKNFLNNYLWISFFTLILLVISISFVIFKVGVISFEDIIALSSKINIIAWIVFLLALFFKLGAPGFHFFKLEIYQLLPFAELIIFSIISFFINSFIFIFLLQNIWFNNTYTNTFLFTYVCISNIYLLLVNFKQVSFTQFFAFSSFNAILMLLFFSLVNVTINKLL